MTKAELEKIRDENSENYREGESCSFYMNEIESYKEGFNCASELLMKEIELLQAKLKVAENALEFYANGKRWEISQCYCGTEEPKSESIGIIHRSDIEGMSGGKRAREALQEIRKKDE